jgi:hypothetical protein
LVTVSVPTSMTLTEPRISVPVKGVMKLTPWGTLPRWLATKTVEPSALKASERGFTPTSISLRVTPAETSTTETESLSRLQTHTWVGSFGSTATLLTCACWAAALDESAAIAKKAIVGRRMGMPS